ncbi:MAG: 8-oxo-dGTP diphosphatase MutT [Colwellia sp.]
MTKRVNVAVGVITSMDASGKTQYFLTKRLEHAHQGGKWEFPGGKVEAEETVAEALFRELKEEVGIEILSCQPLIEINHNYSDKSVCLSVFLVDNFEGEPASQEGLIDGWYSLDALKELDFPEANTAIIDKLLD